MQYIIIHCQRTNSDDVLLVLKDKPEWQSGRLNLPGGKIERGESIAEAATRELIEETGYKPLIPPFEMGLIKDGDDTIFCVKVVVADHTPLNPRPEETQEVFWVSWSKVVNDPRLIPNLRLIIPLMFVNVKGWVIKDQYRFCSQKYHPVEILLPTMV